MADSEKAPLFVRVLRSPGVRLVVDLAALLVVIWGIQSLTSAVRTAVPRAAYFAVFTPLAVPAVLGLYVVLVRVLERRWPSELKPKKAARELAVGFILGAFVFSLTIGIIALLGGYSVTGTRSLSVLAAPLAMGIGSSVVEEIGARAIVFRLLEESLGSWAALVLSSALFGFAHILNPHATVWSAIAIAVEAGTLLGASFMLTRRLWLPIGIHAAWNFTQGGVFGVAVSGAEITGVLRGEVRGPSWLSGGEFGAEASAVAFCVCAFAAIALLVKAIKAGQVRKAPWTRRRSSTTADGALAASE